MLLASSHVASIRFASICFAWITFASMRAASMRFASKHFCIDYFYLVVFSFGSFCIDAFCLGAFCMDSFCLDLLCHDSLCRKLHLLGLNLPRSIFVYLTSIPFASICSTSILSQARMILSYFSIAYEQQSHPLPPKLPIAQRAALLVYI